MTLVTSHAALTDIGLQRRTNEDSYVAAPPLFAVCDGMGGAEAGEVASSLAAETLTARVAAGDSVAEAARAANDAVYARATERVEESGMGTTLTAVTIEDGHGRFAHVGDSRAYLFREGSLQLLSQDHSLVGELVREGRLTWDEAAAHPQRSILSRALGTEPGVEVDEFSVELRAGDVLLLCSDGLSGDLPAEVLREHLSAADPAEAAAGLVAAARAAGGHDNITAVVVRLDEAEPAAGGDTAPMPAVAAPSPPAAEPAAAPPAAEGGEVAAATQAGEPGPEEAAPAGPADAGARTAGPDGDASGRAPDAGGPSDPAAAGAARRARRRLGVLVLVLALVALVGVAGIVVVNTCYFVGEEDGQLAVFSGLPWRLGPLELNSVYLRTARSYATLDPTQRELVDARRVRTKGGALRLAEDLGMLP